MNRGPGLACAVADLSACLARASPRSLAFARLAEKDCSLPACRCATSPKRDYAAAPGLSLRTPAALRLRVRTSPPASSRIAPGSAASPAPQLARRSKLRLYGHNAGAKSADYVLAESLPLGAAFSRCTLLVFSATTAPEPASLFLARIAPCRAACALRCRVGDVASYVTTAASPLQNAGAGNARIPWPLPAGIHPKLLSGGCLLRCARAEARAGRQALLIRFRGPDEHRCSPLPPGSCGLPRRRSKLRLYSRSPLPIAGRDRQREAALAGWPFQDCSRSGSPSPLRLPEQVRDRFLRLRAAHDPRRA